MEQLMIGFLQQLTCNSGFAIIIALLAGLLSSASPCTLAILPAAVAYVGSASGDDRWVAAKSSLIFWLGLAVSLTLLGTLAGQLGFFFAGFGKYWYLLLGIVFAVLGFGVAGWINIVPDNCRVPVQRYGLFGAFIAGMVGGVASSPCATPALAAILALVATKGDWWYGAVLLFAYSFGRGALIFVAGFFSGAVTAFVNSKHGTRLVNFLKTGLAILLLVISLTMFYMGF